ncbi:MAG: preQ(1) synthase [Bacteroidetes bacterium]|nr:preQ(1) synthase [Bacteroidota bacterium]MBU1677743.1 preQ(1) synthase [Bacteroidota bacterium]MBU2506084.1 preQ(1) synthase [Bacteroidota bacterium]
MSEKRDLLETFENQYPERDYIIEHVAPEFTSLCPKTGQPDFATINLEYIPDELCIELKSYKIYLNSFRNDGIYFESVTNQILDDLVEVLQPRYMQIIADFNVRGGISSSVEVEYFSEEYLEDEEDFSNI